MANISIKLRLIGLVVLLISMMLGIGIFGMISTHNIIAHLEADAHREQELAHTAEFAERTEIEFKTQIQQWKNILIRGNDSALYNKHLQSFNKESQIVQENLSELENKYKKLGIDAEEVKLVKEAHLELKHRYDTALKKFNKNNPNSGKEVDRLVIGINKPITNAFDKMVHHLTEEIDKVVEASEKYAEEVEASTRNTDVAIIAGGAVIGIILGLLLIQSIVVPLNKVVRVTQQLAEGDMTVSIEVVGNTEISKVQQALTLLSKNLRSVISQVRDGANSVSISAEEISSGNLDLSSRTEEQAASIEETSSSLEQITEKVQENSASAIQAVGLATDATGKAENGLEVAQTAVNAINEIKTSSEKVADIIGVIDEIAFQTNLLALNASIEAERAGEQGRGFSVVANEVQKLAQRSADAANEIKALIKNSTQKVQEGTELVLRSSQALEDIVKTSNETNELMQLISEASKEQSHGLAQVNTAVAQLEETTQQNAALVEQTSAASTSMNDQAKTLSRLVAFFKFESNSSDSQIEQHSNVFAVPGPSNQAGQVENNQTHESDVPRQHANETVGNLALKSETGSNEDWKSF